MAYTTHWTKIFFSPRVSGIKKFICSCTRVCEGAWLLAYLIGHPNMAKFLSSLSFPSSHRIGKGLFWHKVTTGSCKGHLLQHIIFVRADFKDLAILLSGCKVGEVISKQKWNIVFYHIIPKENLSSHDTLLWEIAQGQFLNSGYRCYF